MAIPLVTNDAIPVLGPAGKDKSVPFSFAQHTPQNDGAVDAVSDHRQSQPGGPCHLPKPSNQPAFRGIVQAVSLG